MCWFSADRRISTRKAIEGEELVVQDFPRHYHRWLASPQNPQKAVCLTDGCTLPLNGLPERLQKVLGVRSEAVAEFRELYQAPRTSLFTWISPMLSFYDVLVFPAGTYLEISELPLGMKIDVLSKAVLTPVKEEKKNEEPQTIYISRRQSTLATTAEVVP